MIRYGHARDLLLLLAATSALAYGCGGDDEASGGGATDAALSDVRADASDDDVAPPDAGADVGPSDTGGDDGGDDGGMDGGNDGGMDGGNDGGMDGGDGGTEPGPCETNAPPFESGSGTEDDPYTICSVAQLRALERRSEFFLLSRDLDMSSGWTPLLVFSGVFNGGGHTLRNIDVSAPAAADAPRGGLIDELIDGGIGNFEVEGLKVRGAGPIGGLIGRTTRTRSGENDPRPRAISIRITGLDVEGTAGPNVGGLIGHGRSFSLLNVNVQGRVRASGQATSRMGFAVGTSELGVLQYARLDGSVSTQLAVKGVGGVFGLVTDSLVDSIEADLDVSTNGDQVGGVFGALDSQSFTTAVRNSRIGVKARAGAGEVGGIVGRLRGSVAIEDLFATVDVAPLASGASIAVGGVVGLVGPGARASFQKMLLDAALPPGACPLSPEENPVIPGRRFVVLDIHLLNERWTDAASPAGCRLANHAGRTRAQWRDPATYSNAFTTPPWTFVAGQDPSFEVPQPPSP